MKSLVCKHASCGKLWKSSAARSSKAWQLRYSRQPVVVAEEVTHDYEQENSRGRTRRRRQPTTSTATSQRQADPNDRHSSSYQPGSHSSQSASNGYYSAEPGYKQDQEPASDVWSSTDRTALANLSSPRGRSRSATRRNRSASRGPAAAASQIAPRSESPPPSSPAPAARSASASRRGRSYRRSQERQASTASSEVTTLLGLPVSTRSRSRSRSPSPVPELDAIKSWLSKDASPSPAPRAPAAQPPPQSNVNAKPLSVPPPVPTAAAVSTKPAPALQRRSRSRSRSSARALSPERSITLDPELEKMKTWLDNHKADDPLTVKPFELVARGHSPARVASPERPLASKPVTPVTKATSSAPAAKPAAAAPPPPPVTDNKPAHGGNGVIDLSNLPSSQKHHIREVYVEDLPQTHEDYGRALKEVTEVTSVMGWAKAQKHDDEHKPVEVPVVVAAAKPTESAAAPAAGAQGGAFSDPALQGTIFTSLAAVSAALGLGALLAPEALLHACFGGATALEATLTRVIGSGVIVSAACNLCLQDASSHNRLGSATYQRLMGAGLWQSVTVAAVLALHAALCTPVLAILAAPLAVAGIVCNSGVLSSATGSPLPPPITLATPTNSTAIGYTALSASLLLSAAACFLPLGLIHGSISYNLPVLHHLCAPGLLAAAIVACVLQDAANRDRLGSSTFKKLNLGLTAALGAFALSLAGGLTQLVVVPTLVTLPVLAVTGAGAVFCMLMFAFSKKQKKA